MLDEKQQEALVEGLTAADVIICLQIIQRLVQAGAIQDQELAAVGTARNHLVEGLQAATGVNFDMARAAQQRAQQEAQARAKAAQDERQAAAQREAAEPAPVVAEPAAEETTAEEAPEA